MFVNFSNAQKTTQDVKAKRVKRASADSVKSQQSNTPMQIIYKPSASYPTSFKNGTVCIQGTVTLRVEFLASGEIGKIAVVSSLPYGATENAMEAAKKIKFKPAVKNGKPVDFIKQVQFSFSIY